MSSDTDSVLEGKLACIRQLVSLRRAEQDLKRPSKVRLKAFTDAIHVLNAIAHTQPVPGEEK